MDTIYPLSLLISLAAGAVAISFALLLRFPALRVLLPARMRRLVNGQRGLALSVLLASAALLVSLLVHFTWGHRPGSPEALQLRDFFRIHPSFIVAGLLPALAVAVHVFPPSRNNGHR
jgi:hypothetical protein